MKRRKNSAPFFVFVILMWLWLLCVVASASLQDCLDATCRVHQLQAGRQWSIGSGCAFYAKGESLYILTAAHVVPSGRPVTVDFWKDHEPQRMQGAVVRNYWPVADLAIVACDRSDAPWVTPIPLAPASRSLPREAATAGCPKGLAPSLFYCRIRSARGDTFTFDPPAASGRSGSAVFDRDGTMILGVLAIKWGEDQQHGGGLHVAGIRRALSRPKQTAWRTRGEWRAAAVDAARRALDRIDRRLDTWDRVGDGLGEIDRKIESYFAEQCSHGHRRENCQRCFGPNCPQPYHAPPQVGPPQARPAPGGASPQGPQWDLRDGFDYDSPWGEKPQEDSVPKGSSPEDSDPEPAPSPSDVPASGCKCDSEQVISRLDAIIDRLDAPSSPGKAPSDADGKCDCKDVDYGRVSRMVAVDLRDEIQRDIRTEVSAKVEQSVGDHFASVGQKIADEIDKRLGEASDKLSEDLDDKLERRIGGLEAQLRRHIESHGGAPPSGEQKHIVVVGAADADYARRLSDEVEKTSQYFDKIKLVEPPSSVNVGSLPKLVLYVGGTPAVTYSGTTDVYLQLSRIRRGEFP